MGSTENNLAGCAKLPESGSLFEQCSWFYALCREYLFRDQTTEISRSLFPSAPPPGTNLLELVCGPGFYACKLAQIHPQISAVGLDLSANLVERARDRAARRSLGNCSFWRGDAQSLPELPFRVDAIILSRLLLIVPDKMAVLSEVYRVLRPGGRCFIAEPTSGFRTRFPLSCMWLLSRFSSIPAGKYREPQQADVMSGAEFTGLVNSQPWGSVEVVRDGWYQYAVCAKQAEEDQPSANLKATDWNGPPR